MKKKSEHRIQETKEKRFVAFSLLSSDFSFSLIIPHPPFIISLIQSPDGEIQDGRESYPQ